MTVLAALALVAVGMPTYTIQTFEGWGFNALNSRGVAAGLSLHCVKWDGKVTTKLPKDMWDVAAINDSGTIVGKGFADHDIPIIIRDGVASKLPVIGFNGEGQANAVNSAQRTHPRRPTRRRGDDSVAVGPPAPCLLS